MKFEYSYPTEMPEPEPKSTTEITLMFEKWGSGLILKAKNEVTKVENNLMYVTEYGDVYFYPQQAETLGLEASCP